MLNFSMGSNVILFGVSIVLGFIIIPIARKLSTEPFSRLDYGIVVLGTASGFIHLGIGLQGDLLLLLNGLGYLVLVFALYLPNNFITSKRAWVGLLLLVYTAVTIFGYLLTHTFAQYSRLGLVTKALELILVFCLIMKIKVLFEPQAEAIDFDTNI